MSRSEGRKPGLELKSFDALEAAVARMIRQLEVWRERAAASEKERQRLQEIVDGLEGEGGDVDVKELHAEVEELRERNGKLERQLEEGRREAQQLAREVEFLEDTR